MEFDGEMNYRQGGPIRYGQALMLVLALGVFTLIGRNLLPSEPVMKDQLACSSVVQK